MKLNQNIQKHHTFLRFSRWNFSPHEGCLWTPESRKILRIESEMLDFGIRNAAQGIRNPTSKLESRIQVLLTKTGIEYLESGIHSVESTIQDCLGFPHMGRNFTSQAASINPWISHIQVKNEDDCVVWGMLCSLLKFKFICYEIYPEFSFRVCASQERLWIY